MGVSTDGQICFGNVYEEDFEFPWDEYDLEDWWRKEQGFDESKDYPAEGWLDYQKEFDAAHPCPVKLVNYCSGEYPMWILAVPSTVRSNSRGQALRFDPSELVVSDVEAGALSEFCIKYDLIPEEDAGWYLTSYWG
jgi:hypothetical protein